MKADLKIKMDDIKAALRQNEGDISRDRGGARAQNGGKWRIGMCGESDSQPEPWAQKLMDLRQ